MAEKRTKEITVGKDNNQKVFMLQDPGPEWYLEHLDSCKGGSGQLLHTKYAKGMLDFVVIEPQGFKLNQFAHAGEVIDFINQVDSFLTTD